MSLLTPLRLVVGVVAAMAVHASPVRAADPVRIGVLLPITGPNAKGGLEDWTAMEIARDMINEGGGIAGRPVEYVRGDIVTPTAAISETNRLITSDGIKLTTGSYASPFALAVSQAAERDGVLHWETTGAADTITKRGFKYTFQLGASATRYGRAALDFTRDVLAPKLGKDLHGLRIALLWENRAFGSSVGTGVRDYARELGLTLVYDDGYDQTLTDMTPLVQKLKDVKPDVVISISFLNDAILFQRKAKELDFNVPAFIGVSAGYSAPDLKDALGGDVDGIFVSDFPARVNPAALAPDVRRADDAFFERYQAKQHRLPAGHASATFSALWLLFTKVLPNAGPMQPDDVRAAALGLDLPYGSMVNGSGVKFTNHDWAPDPKDAGQNLRSTIGVWQWQKGAAHQVYPAELATDAPTAIPLPAWSER